MTRIAMAVVIVAWVVGSVGPVGAQPSPTSGEMAASADAAQRQVVLYYFHGDKRCKTCRTVEAFAEETVASRFAGELNAGELAWKVVNYDDDENRHFVKQYGLVSASLVLVELDGGEPVRFEVLQKAWSLVRDKAGFEQYVRESVIDFLG